MRRRVRLLGLSCWMGFFSIGAFSQGVYIGYEVAGGSQASALLDLNVSGMSTKKGLLIPRMTETQKQSISSPATSLMVFQTDAGFYYFDGSQWLMFGGEDDLGNHTAEVNLDMNGFWVSGDGDSEGLLVDNLGNVGVGEAAPEAALHTNGSVRMNTLSGSGTRMVVADNDGDLSTQAIPSGGVGSGTALYLNLTSDVSDVDVTGISFIHVSTNGNHDVEGLNGGTINQVIYLVNTGTVDDIKFKKDEGTQQLLKDLDLKKEEGAAIMFNGTNWQIISKH